ncbi:hypothetical protein [Opitutus sp. ER46]|uniref:hypothetical protein n=1 Tax=Opitutus sp. ER46 TaxID=2161864 RepID=UPI0011B1CBA2|nr:hypothetical protein [Opitutus sp. ER46]
MCFPRIPLVVAAFCAAASCLSAVEPVRLPELGATRFVERDGHLVAELGLYGPFGGFKVRESHPVLTTVTVPDEAKNQVLIKLRSWIGYKELGPEAVINFSIPEYQPIYTIGYVEYVPLALAADPKLDAGKLVNISARGQASRGSKLIAGFVIDEQSRLVLIRAVGPGLAVLNVTDRMANPYVTLYRHSMPILYNDNWGDRLEADKIPAAAAKVGAFPLSAGSKDAAILTELEPGLYTAVAEPSDDNGSGTVLLEVYSIPTN